MNHTLDQVCASLADPRIKQSEVRSRSEAMVKLAVAEGTIATWRTDETIPVGFGAIQVAPARRFLLEMGPRAQNNGASYFRFVPLPKITLVIGLISHPMAR